MKLKALLNGIEILNCKITLETEISNIASDHRRASNHSVFVAIKGTKRDGNVYIGNALKNGAVAIITDSNDAHSKYAGCILVANARKTLSKMWSNFYSNPSKTIKTVAITGTNGKTSSAYFLYNILRESNISCALISTIECLINDERIETFGGGSVTDISSAMTTPDPETLYYLYNKMKEKNVSAAVIEASSHALEQERLSAIDVEIGAFTNLSREHLDYHETIDKYFEAKKKLFEKSKYRVINADDEYGKALIGIFDNSYGYSIKQKSDFYASNINCSMGGCEYDFVSNDTKLSISTGIIGEFTVYNTLLAIACAKLLNVDNKAIQKGIEKTNCIKGRMEKYRDKNIYIDYAHTPKAMEQIIRTVRQIEPQKRLIVLFGCGGDRDKGKRAEMGQIGTSLSDFVIITSDNSRTENTAQIINDIVSGIDGKSNFVTIPNRCEAIHFLARSLKENDVALLLGKGHEEYEILENEKRHFNEREILDEVFMIDL